MVGNIQKFYIGGDTCIFGLFLVSKRKECWKFSLHYLHSLHWYEINNDNISEFKKIDIHNQYVLNLNLDFPMMMIQFSYNTYIL